MSFYQKGDWRLGNMDLYYKQILPGYFPKWSKRSLFYLVVAEGFWEQDMVAFNPPALS